MSMSVHLIQRQSNFNPKTIEGQKNVLYSFFFILFSIHCEISKASE